MRIVDGSNAATGRVEVQRNGVWGTVCNNGFDYLAARVVCAGLCFELVPGISKFRVVLSIRLHFLVKCNIFI